MLAGLWNCYLGSVVHIRTWSAVVLGVEELNASSVCRSLFLNLHSGLVSAASAKVGVHVLMNGFSNGLKLVTNVDGTVSLSINGFRLVSNVEYFSPCRSWFPGKGMSDSLPGENFKWLGTLLFIISGEIPCVCQQCS